MVVAGAEGRVDLAGGGVVPVAAVVRPEGVRALLLGRHLRLVSRKLLLLLGRRRGGGGGDAPLRGEDLGGNSIGLFQPKKGPNIVLKTGPK